MMMPRHLRAMAVASLALLLGCASAAGHAPPVQGCIVSWQGPPGSVLLREAQGPTAGPPWDSSGSLEVRVVSSDGDWPMHGAVARLALSERGRPVAADTADRRGALVLSAPAGVYRLWVTFIGTTPLSKQVAMRAGYVDTAVVRLQVVAAQCP